MISVNFMFQRILICSVSIFLLFSCDTQGVKNVNENPNTIVPDSNTIIENIDTTPVYVVPEQIFETKVDDSVFKTKEGVVITWSKKGAGKKLAKNDLIHIDYRQKLSDGTIFDGNHFIKKEQIPFLVGWNLQTKGWDIALKEMNIGDKARISIPSDYAWGEKGYGEYIPPNEDITLDIHIIDAVKPDHTIDGTKVWRIESNEKLQDSIVDGDEVDIVYYVSSESNPYYDNAYKHNKPFKLTMGDGNIVPGLYKALKKAKNGDKLYVLIPAKEAYGSKGLSNLVKRNEDIFYDLTVVRVKHK